MPRLLLVRHGQSTWNALGRWQGIADPPLSPLGEQQATEAIGTLRPLAPSVVWSSHLQRARRTAEIVAGGLGVDTVHVEPDVCERDVGDWTGLSRAEIADRWPEVGEAWGRGEAPHPSTGEDTPGFVKRVSEALRRIATTPRSASTGDGPVLVITHGGVIAWLAHDLGAERGEFTNLGGRWFDVDVEQAVITPGEVIWSFAPDHGSMTTSL